MRLFDTHCHLDHPLFADTDKVLTESAAAGVCRIVIPGVEARGWQRILTLTRQYPALSAAPGVHPLFTAGTGPATLDRLDSLLELPTVAAVGEIGLDFFPKKRDEETQRRLFSAQLSLARNHRLPVLLHVRRAHDQVLALLRRAKLDAGGIVHAFSGSRQQADQYASLGFALGIGGAITWPRAQKLRRLATSFPADHLVLETDAPDMPLYPDRKKANHPRQLLQVLKTLAELRREEVQEVAAQCWKNSCAIFPADPGESPARHNKR